MAETWSGSCAGETREVPGGAHVFKGRVLGRGRAVRVAHIDRFGALPSYSPFLVWQVRLRFDPATAKHVLLERPERVAPLRVARDALVAAVRRETATTGPGFARWLKRLALPPTLRRVEDLPPQLASAARLVRDALQPPRFYDLLPFFPATFLRGFEAGELEVLWAAFEARPEMFAFWDVVARELALPAEKLRMAPRQAMGEERFRLHYRDGRPALSAPLLPQDSPRRAAVEAALRWSEGAWSRFVWRGDLWHPAPRAPGALAFLLEIGAVVEVRGAGVAFRDARAAEEALAAKLERIAARGGVRAVQVQLGPAELARRLSEERTLSIVFGTVAGENWLARTAWVPPAPTAGAPLHVVQAHKMGPGELLRILEDLDPPQLTLLGDEEEGAANYARGGGDVFRAARRKFPARVGEWAARDATLARDLRGRRAVGVETANEVELAKIFASEWWTKEPRDKMALCSDEKTRAALLKRMDKEDLRPGRRVHVLDVDIVGFLGSATEVDTGRALPRTEHLRWGLDYDITLEEVDGFARTPIWGGRYSRVALERADVAIAARYPGPPVPVVVFFASKWTALDELCAATKHASQDFRLVWLPGTSIADAPEKRPAPTITLFH